MLLHDEGVCVDVEGELLAVQGDEDGAGHVVGNLVRDLLTERVHVVVPEVVVGVVHPGDGQAAPGHLRLDLSSPSYVMSHGHTMDKSLPEPGPPRPWGPGLC